MRLRKRILYLRQPKEAVRRSMYGLICSDLQKAIQEWSCQDGTMLTTWPTVDWRDDKQQIQISSWSSEQEFDHRLLSVELTEENKELTWTLSLRIGSIHDDEIVIQEECHLESAVAQVPFFSMPDILDFLPTYDCINEDNLYAGKSYTIAQNRAQAFTEFICSESSERKLPVILVSPENGSREFLLPPKELAVHFSGMAHVMTLSQSTNWYSKHLPLQHPCYNGAIRLYLPGYRTTDESNTHPYWGPERLKENNTESIFEDIQNYILRWTPDKDSDTLIALDRLRTEEQNQYTIRREIESIRQRIRNEAEAHATAQLETFWQELIRDAEKFSSDYDRLSSENALLQKQIQERDDEIRQLQYRLKQQWIDEEGLPDQLKQPTTQVYLSKKASTVYASLVHGVRVDIDNQLLHKLCDPIMRSSQTEPVLTRNGTCFVFPRSRSAAGRRVIYATHDNNIHIYELYLHHDHYEHDRSQGFDLTEHSDFDLWQPE